MKAMLVMGAVAALVAAGPVQAQSGSEVLKAKGCLNCHDFQAKKMGPAYKDVAAKYKGNAGAQADLVAKLKNGTGHVKVQATDAELNVAVKQVLAGK